jgi:hypothetical protein
MSGSTYTSITGLTATITPKSTANRILVRASVNASQDFGVNNGFVQLVRGTTAIGIGDAAGSRRRAGFAVAALGDSYPITGTLEFLDSPASIAAITYGVQITAHQGGGTMFVNRGDSDPDNGFAGRFASTITVMEVSA